MEKGLILDIYRTSYKCSLNKFNNVENVLLPHPCKVFEENETRPTIKIIKRHLFGGEYIHAEPANKEPNEYFAFGGSFVYSSDSRFKDVAVYPIPLHDRRMNMEK